MGESSYNSVNAIEVIAQKLDLIIKIQSSLEVIRVI
jgi:hypothetical protein